MVTKKRGLKHHLVHKGKLSLLLVLKILLAFVSFFLVMVVLFYFSPWATFGAVSFINIMIWGIGLSIASVLYLFLILRVLDLLKF